MVTAIVTAPPHSGVRDHQTSGNFNSIEGNNTTIAIDSEIT